jgi:DNA-binding CsgD family transcriptional regulator
MTAATTHLLRDADYQTLLRLLGQLGELAPDPLARRRHALHGLAAALDAQCALFCHTRHEPDGTYRLLDNVLVGLEDAPQGPLRQYFAGQLPFDPCAPQIERAAPAGHVTFLRRQLVDDRDWYRADHVNGLRRDLRLDDGVYARLVSPGKGHVFGVSLIRASGARPFTERHRQMFHLFHQHAQNLYRLDDPLEPPTPATLAALPPRLRAVAKRFLAGDSVKQAARLLGLSPHTVAEYAKALHRTLNVSSRSELLIALMRPPTDAPPTPDAER